MEKLWTAAEAARWLGMTEHDVEALVRQGKLTGYQLGGRYLRVRPEEVKGLRGNIRPSVAAAAAGESSKAGERLRQFFYFYDFYLVSAGLLAVLVAYLVAAS